METMYNYAEEACDWGGSWYVIYKDYTQPCGVYFLAIRDAQEYVDFKNMKET